MGEYEYLAEPLDWGKHLSHSGKAEQRHTVPFRPPTLSAPGKVFSPIEVRNFLLHVVKVCESVARFHGAPMSARSFASLTPPPLSRLLVLFTTLHALPKWGVQDIVAVPTFPVMVILLKGLASEEP